MDNLSFAGGIFSNLGGFFEVFVSFLVIAQMTTIPIPGISIKIGSGITDCPSHY